MRSATHDSGAGELVVATGTTASPDDRLEAALEELRDTVATEVLETLHQVTPQQFESIVLDLLHRMGYGASRTTFSAWAAWGMPESTV